jgi:hypothetical protein
MFVRAVSAAKAFICGLHGWTRALPERAALGGTAVDGIGFLLRRDSGDANKKSRRGGMLGQADFGQGSGVPPDSGKTILRSRLVR